MSRHGNGPPVWPAQVGVCRLCKRGECCAVVSQLPIHKIIDLIKWVNSSYNQEWGCKTLMSVYFIALGHIL